MTYNGASGQALEDLIERAVAAIAREWGISEDEARAALDRNMARERRLTREVARHQVWALYPEQRAPLAIDLTEPVEVAT
jgi:hypothetical protein